MPALLRIMKTDSLIKMKTHAVSTLINFVGGLNTQDDEDEEGGDTGAENEIIKLYSAEIFETLVNLLKEAIDPAVNYEPLQEECMNLLSAVAQLSEKDFAKYYGVLMPIMMQILTNVGTANMQQMNLRARTIETMGYMIEAVAEEKASFAQSVHEIA